MFLLNALVYGHFVAFLIYVATMLIQWDRSEKRTTRWMLACGIVLLLTGLGLIAYRYPAINYYKVIPKMGLLLLISGITAAHNNRPMSLLVWRSLLGLAVLAALIAAWRVA